DGGVESDAESQGEDDDGGEAGRAAEAAKALAKVLKETVDGGKSPGVMRAFGDRGRVAEAGVGRGAGGVRREAAIDVALDLHVEMSAEFVGEIGVKRGVAAEEV